MWTMNKKFQAFFAAIVLLMVSATAPAQDEHPAQVLVQGAITEMLSYLSDNINEIKSDPSLVLTKADEVIVPHLDFLTMTRLTVGDSWRDANEAQQKDLVEQFQMLLLNTYTAALTQYSGEAIEFQPFQPESRDDRAIVNTAFKQNGGSDVPVTYKLREKSGWQIYDIDVAGLSLVGNFKKRFTNEIEDGGIDGLLDFLRKRNNR